MPLRGANLRHQDPEAVLHQKKGGEQTVKNEEIERKRLRSSTSKECKVEKQMVATHLNEYGCDIDTSDGNRVRQNLALIFHALLRRNHGIEGLAVIQHKMQ